MKNRLAGLICILATVIATGTNLSAQEDTNPFGLIFEYSADVAGNATGGMKKGAGVLGYGYTGFSFSTEKAHWWDGGTLTLTLGATHGSMPSADWMGDFQVADNIESGNHIFLQEFNLQQEIGSLQISLGMQDICANYVTCDPALLFFNSSFGIHSVASMNMEVPIFPILGLGANVKWNITERLYAEAGIYDTPLGFDENPYNITFNLGSEQGYIAASEIGYTLTIGNQLSGHYKIGLLHQTNNSITTFHLCAWQEAWRRGQRCVTPFVILSHSPSESANHNMLLAAGATMQGVLFDDGRDQLGLGLTSAKFDHDVMQIPLIGTAIAPEYMRHHSHHETAIELTYRYAVTDNISLQPEIQYIINPSGNEAKSDNPLFIALRLHLAY